MKSMSYKQKTKDSGFVFQSPTESYSVLIQFGKLGDEGTNHILLKWGTDLSWRIETEWEIFLPGSEFIMIKVPIVWFAILV